MVNSELSSYLLDLLALSAAMNKALHLKASFKMLNQGKIYGHHGIK